MDPGKDIHQGFQHVSLQPFLAVGLHGFEYQHLDLIQTRLHSILTENYASNIQMAHRM